MSWKGFTSAAAMAVFACGSAAYASQGEQIEIAGSGSQLVNPAYLDDAATMPTTSPAEAAAPASAPSQTTLTPVMFLLDKTSFGQWLEANKFSVTGFMDIGYFIDTNNPRLGTGPNGDSPTLVTFAGPYSNRFLLDQADITFSERGSTRRRVGIGVSWSKADMGPMMRSFTPTEFWIMRR